MSEIVISGFRGRQISAADNDYDEARALYNGMIDKRPKLIARCVDVADVLTAVAYARDNKLLLATRGGGHNGPGFGSCDDGLVVDLSQLKGVRVDPKAATVRVEPGCTSADVDHATHAFGLAVPFGIVGSTGVAGLTLGGGSGYLTRKHGLTIEKIYDSEYSHSDAYVVAEALAEFDELFQKFRYHHMQLIHRTIGLGAKSLKGRSVELLQEGMRHQFFPELWEIRNKMTDAWGARYGVVRDSIGGH